jgi:hypothetical protein
LIACNILYEYNIWPKRQNVNALPKREQFEALVRETITSPGPLVIEVETLPLRIAPQLAKHNMEMLAQLADWAHEAAPGKVIGFYGTNTLCNVLPEDQAIAKELANHVHAFFPSLYTFDDNRAGSGEARPGGSTRARREETNLFLSLAAVPRWLGEGAVVCERRLLEISTGNSAALRPRCCVVESQPLRLGRKIRVVGRNAGVRDVAALEFRTAAWVKEQGMQSKL